MKSWIPPFSRRYRFTWRQNEKEDVAPLGVAFGRINRGRMCNYSWHRGRSTGPRESVKKDCFGDRRGGGGSKICLRQAISLLGRGLLLIAPSLHVVSKTRVACPQPQYRRPHARTRRGLLDTSGNKFSSRNGLENIFESPATKLV